MQGRILFVVTIALTIFGAVLFNSQTPAQDGVLPIRSGAPHVNPNSISVLMKAKLTNAQLALAALVDQDFDQLREAARTLKLTSLSAPGLQSDDEMEDKVFDHFETEFIRLAGKLEQMAQQKNLEGAAFEYQNLTATCIACHQHIRDAAHTANASRKTESERAASKR